MDFDVTPFLHPGDPWVAEDGPELARRIYDEKFRLAALLRPKHILEIGVRYGYGAAAFLSASPGSFYYGIDADNGRYGGVVGAALEAASMLEAHFPGLTNVVVADTDKVTSLPPLPWGLIHVDGGHSYDNCLHDLQLAEAARPRWILVDDQFHHEEVAAATRDWLRTSGWRWVLFPTVRGDLLAQPPD